MTTRPSIASQGAASLGQLGSVPALAGVSADTVKRGNFNVTTVTFTAYSLAVNDTTPITTGGAVKIFDFPEGVVSILAAAGSLTFTTTSALAGTLNASVNCHWGVGSAATADGADLTTTEQNIIPKTAFTSSATINVANTATRGVLAAPLSLDGAGTAIDAHLNVGVITNTDIDADATVAVNGTIVIVWANIIDF
jgi:hypothetical protein